MAVPRFVASFVYNATGTAMPVLAAFVTVPIYIAHIGAARYGVLSIAWLLLGYAGFLDFGLSRATANALSRLGHAPASERVPVLVTSFYLNLGLGLAGGVALYLTGELLLDRFFNVPGTLRGETLASFGWMAALLPMGMLGGVASGALDSREKFLLANTLAGLGSVFGQVIPVICAVAIGPSLTVVLPAVFFSRLLSLVVALSVVARVERPVRPGAFDRSKMRELFGYGAWVSVSSILVPVLDTFDQMLLGILVGVASVAHYAVPMNLVMRSQILAAALARTLFPQLSRLEPAQARAMATRAAIALAYGFGAVCGPGSIFAASFLRLWIGHDFAVFSAPVAKILFVGAWWNGLAFIPYTLLQGQGRPDLTAKAHAAEVVPFVGLLYVLTLRFGLPGAACAWALRMAADGVILFRLARCPAGELGRAIPAVGLMLACLALSWTTDLPLGWSALAAAGAGLAFLGAGVAFEPMLRSIAARALRLSRRPVAVPG